MERTRRSWGEGEAPASGAAGRGARARSGRRGRAALPVLVGMIVALAPAAARAQANAEDKAQARELARMGFDAMDAKDWAKAEDLFRRADALYHAPTLTVALARAEAKLGKVVEAWEAYHRVLVEGVAAGANEAMVQALENAKKEIGEVEARRARVTLDVDGAEHPAVTVDGVAVDAASLRAARPVDPGTHAVHATADGFAPADATFTVAEGGAVTVPVHLVPVAPAAPVAAAGGAAAGAGGAAGGAGAGAAGGGGGAERRNHVPAFVAFGVGGAGVVMAVVGGALAVGKHGDLKGSPCASGACADPGPFNSTLSQYHTLAAVSTAGVVVAAVGVAAGVTLWFVGPREKEAAGAGVGVTVGVGSVGVAGRF